MTQESQCFFPGYSGYNNMSHHCTRSGVKIPLQACEKDTYDLGEPGFSLGTQDITTWLTTAQGLCL